MTVTSREKVPTKRINKISRLPKTQSISSASAALDMSDAEFIQRYIKTRRLQVDRLHQVRISDVSDLMEQLGLCYMTHEMVWNMPKRYTRVMTHSKVIPLHKRGN